MKREKHTSGNIGKTETFWTRNVRTITFLICAVLILSVFGPISILYIDEYLESWQTDERREMALSDVIAISHSPRTLTASALERYRGEKSENGEKEQRTVTYQISVGTRYFLMAGFYAESGQVYYLNLTDLQEKRDIDLLDPKTNLEEFLK